MTRTLMEEQKKRITERFRREGFEIEFRDDKAIVTLGEAYREEFSISQLLKEAEEIVLPTSIN